MEIDKTTFQELRAMSGEDFIDELIDTFLDDAPKLVGAMRAALQTNDAEGFRRAAHSLKSNSATFGATRLSALAKDMEMMGKEGKLGEAQAALPPLESALELAAQELKGLRK